MLSAFPGMAARRKGTHAVITGWPDQSVLYGALAELEAFGLVLLEVRRMERPATSQETGDTRCSRRASLFRADPARPMSARRITESQ
jgi:hypothetical protein